MSTFIIRDNYGGLLPSPVDHTGSTLSHLAHTEGAAQSAPGCRVSGRDNAQVPGHHSEHLTVAAAGRVCSMGVRAIVYDA